jgi:hypothetical protein
VLLLLVQHLLGTHQGGVAAARHIRASELYQGSARNIYQGTRKTSMRKGEISFVVWMAISVILLIAIIFIIISLNAKGGSILDKIGDLFS